MLIQLLTSSTLTVGSQDLHSFPATLTLKSSAGGRKIEVSTDGGTEYYLPAIAATSATMLVVNLMYPVTHVKFTGAISDTAIVHQS
jgi:hypothetical protein